MRSRRLTIVVEVSMIVETTVQAVTYLFVTTGQREEILFVLFRERLRFSLYKQISSKVHKVDMIEFCQASLFIRQKHHNLRFKSALSTANGKESLLRHFYSPTDNFNVRYKLTFNRPINVIYPLFEEIGVCCALPPRAIQSVQII